MALDKLADAVLLPADPPRESCFALWSLTRGASRPHQEVVVGLRRGRGMRRQTMPVRTVSIADAVPWLVSLRADEPASASLRAWATVVKAAVALVARGRLQPGVTPGGHDTWRVGPLDSADRQWLDTVIAGFPARAHSLALPGNGPLRVQAAEVVVRAAMDAVADTIVRTAGAADAVAHPAFVATGRVNSGALRDWLKGDLLGLGEGIHLGLRLTPSAQPHAPLVAVLQLRGAADPSLVVDVAEVWAAAPHGGTGLGHGAGDEVLAALGRGALVWAPLRRLLDGEQESNDPQAALALTDDEAADITGPVGEALAAAGIEVLWPTEMAGHQLVARAVVGNSLRDSRSDSSLSLDALLDFAWEVTLAGEALTTAEIAELSAATRPLIRLRGHWLMVDPDLVALLRGAPVRVRARDALGAALSGEMVVAGQVVATSVFGPLADFAVRISEIARPTELSEPVGLTATLRAYQRRGVAWLSAMCQLGVGGCLADDMGLGKTVQVIALHLHRRGGPMLVVCPTSLLGTWEREIRRFAPGLEVRRYHGGDRHLGDLGAQEVVLATYGMVRRERVQLADVGWDLVVADEAQHIKNPQSRIAHEMRQIPARARLALTGTPVENRLVDLWSILDWTTPGLLGPLNDFRAKVAAPIERDHDIEATQNFARLVRPFLLRRRKIDPDIAPELPLKTEADVIVPLTAEQVALYEAVVTQSLAAIATSEGIARRGMVLKLITALKQICNHPAQYLHETAITETAGDDQEDSANRSGKLGALDELLDVIVDEGDSVLVFTQYVAMARLIRDHLQRRGIDSQFLHGQVPVAKRDAMVQRFQSGVVPVFLLSLKAGGVGLTLTRANHVIHFDRWWNPAVEDQATDRAYRIGQDRPVQVHRLVTEGTIEDRIAAMLEAKRQDRR